MEYPLRNTLQIGNYLTDKYKKKYQVVAINYKITVMDEKAELLELAPSQLLPLPLTSVVLQKCKVEPIQVIKEDLHSKMRYRININQKPYILDIWEYENKSMCVFRQFTILYLHQLQNALKLFEPSFELKLF